MGVGPIVIGGGGPAAAASTLLLGLSRPFDEGDTSWSTTGGSIQSSDSGGQPFYSSDFDFGVDDYNGDQGVVFEMTPPGVLLWFVQLRVKYADGAAPVAAANLSTFLYDGASVNFLRGQAQVAWDAGSGFVSDVIAVPVVDAWEADPNPDSTKTILAGFAVSNPRSGVQLRIVSANAALLWLPS